MIRLMRSKIGLASDLWWNFYLNYIYLFKANSKTLVSTTVSFGPK